MDDTKVPDHQGFTVTLTLEGRGSFSASGSSDQVFKALEQFREEVRGNSAPAQATSTGGPIEAAPATPPPRVKPLAASSLPPLPVFLKEKAPRNNPEAVAVLMAWDKNQNGTEDFTTKQISDLWRRSARKVAANLARDIDVAAKSGWLYKKERGKWEIVEYGERFVADLPASKE